MVEAGLEPTDPVRWWLAYAIERSLEERNRDAGGDANDIEVLGG